MIPLVLVEGMIQRLDPNDRLEVRRLNIGEFEHIVATSRTITVSNSFVRLTAPSGTQNVDIILGGQEGDVLVLFGNNIRLRRRNDGNLKLGSNTLLNNNGSTLLVCVGAFWVQPGGD